MGIIARDHVIHREHVHDEPHCRHLAARSLIFAFPDPDRTPEKKPIPFDPERPFRSLGARVLQAGGGATPTSFTLGAEEVELTLRER